MKDDDVSDELNFFVHLEVENLSNLLENEKKVFWLNVYNGIVQVQLSNMEGDSVDKSIFSMKLFEIAGHNISLDDIEHGVIRGNKWKYGLGYLSGKHLPKQIRNWKCKQLDPRIHFQLNCGAASCPMIRVLNVDILEQELELGESDYVLQESTINKDSNQILLSGLFLFYLKDFGGMKGVKLVVKKHFPNLHYKVSFQKFDWTKAPKKSKLK